MSVIINSKVAGTGRKPLTTLIYLSTTQVVENNTGHTVTWALSIDDVSAWTIGDPTKLIVPDGATGCRFALHAEWGVSTVGYRSMRINVNGAAAEAGTGDPYYSLSCVQQANETISCHQSSTGLYMKCVPGDEITMLVRQTSGGQLNLLGAASYMAAEWYYD